MRTRSDRGIILLAALLACALAAWPAGAAPGDGSVIIRPAGEPSGSATIRPAASKPAATEAPASPNALSPTLEEVSNAGRFKGTPEQKKLLAQNRFVVTPTDTEQLFFIYENNDYSTIPSFVTTDLVLQLYHIFFDFTLRKVESDKLSPLLRRMTATMTSQAVSTWKNVFDAPLKRAALKNVVFFMVADELLAGGGAPGEDPPGRRAPPAPVPEEVRSAVRAELARIEKHGGFELGSVFPYKIDYSQFVPRGHYTRTEELKRFFKAMMWYGLAPFSFYRQTEEGVVRSDETVLMGLLMVRGMYQADVIPTWERIYEPTAFYVGLADDLTPAEYKTLMDEVFGQSPPVTAYLQQASFDAFVEKGKQARQPLIKPRVEHVAGGLLPFPDPATAQLRVMGQRYIPDSEMLQNLSIPYKRFFPSGMDVMAVLGSERARALLDTEFPQAFDTKTWADYPAERRKLEAAFAGITEEQWTRNMYWGWLWAVQALLQPAPKNGPAFMQGTPWLDKSLHTALASWAELRHDTILYGKQSVTAAECGGEDEEQPPMPKGYVEPNVEFYRRLITLTRLSREGLTKRALLSKDLTEKFGDLEDLVVFLRDVSEKELAGRKLTRDEYDQIRVLGSEVERISLAVIDGEVNGWSEITSPVDRDMAVVADVHTGGELPKIMALEEGVGHAAEILVVVPVEGKLQINRGAVFSYYEFLHPQDDRLTDEKWQEMRKAGTGPKPPVWTRSFLAPQPKGKNGAEPESMSVEMYSSGC